MKFNNRDCYAGAFILPSPAVKTKKTGCTLLIAARQIQINFYFFYVCVVRNGPCVISIYRK